MKVLTVRLFNSIVSFHIHVIMSQGLITVYSNSHLLYNASSLADVGERCFENVVVMMMMMMIWLQTALDSSTSTCFPSLCTYFYMSVFTHTSYLLLIILWTQIIQNKQYYTKSTIFAISYTSNHLLTDWNPIATPSGKMFAVVGEDVVAVVAFH